MNSKSKEVCEQKKEVKRLQDLIGGLETKVAQEAENRCCALADLNDANEMIARLEKANLAAMCQFYKHL